MSAEREAGYRAAYEQLPVVRLEYLREQIQAESISYGEIAELQGLAEYIEPGDVQLLEWAGVPEGVDHKILVVSTETLEQGDDLVFTGDLDAAKAFVQQHHGTEESGRNGFVEVRIGYDLGPVPWEDTAEYGRASDSDMAWRFALGAHFGPVDDEFHGFVSVL